MEGNFIKLYRSMLEWEWYKNINTKIVFLHCLLKANWKDGKFEGTTVPRGSFITSIKQLSADLQLTEDEVKTALKHLLKTGELTKQTTNKYTVITVVCYDFYQKDAKQIPNENQTVTQQMPNSYQPIPNQLPTIEEGKNIKKERREEGKKGKKEGAKAPEKKAAVYYQDDEQLNSAFAAFAEMRQKIKKPMTDRAVAMAKKRLEQLAGNDHDKAVRILDQSVLNCWQNLYGLKEDGRKDRDIFEEWRDA